MKVNQSSIGFRLSILSLLVAAAILGLWTTSQNAGFSLIHREHVHRIFSIYSRYGWLFFERSGLLTGTDPYGNLGTQRLMIDEWMLVAIFSIPPAWYWHRRSRSRHSNESYWRRLISQDTGKLLRVGMLVSWISVLSISVLWLASEWAQETSNGKRVSGFRLNPGQVAYLHFLEHPDDRASFGHLVDAPDLLIVAVRSTPVRSAGDRYRVLLIDAGLEGWWLISAACTVFTTFSWLEDRRLCNRLLSGCCPYCGYDLRASGDQCPECGKPKPSILRVPATFGD